MRISEDVPFSTWHPDPEKARCIRARGTSYRELDFWRYGTLESGRSFGVLRAAVAMDPGYYEFEAALVDGDGICRRSVLLGEHYGQTLPEVMAFGDWHPDWLTIGLLLQ